MFPALNAAFTEPNYEFITLSGLLSIFSITTSLAFHSSLFGNLYIILRVETLIGWPIVQAAKTITADVLISYIREEIVGSFLLPSPTVTNNERASRVALLHI